MKQQTIIKAAICAFTTLIIGAMLWYALDAHDNWGNRGFLWFLLLVPPLQVYMMFWGSRKVASIRTSSLKLFGPMKSDLLVYLRESLVVLRIVAIAALFIAFARPQFKYADDETSREGIDIVISLDLSTSMYARDFEPDRLAVAKKTAIEFVEGRKNDRFGFVGYAGRAITLAPLTTDHEMVKYQLKRCNLDNVGMDGTAVGLGLGFAVNRLRESDAPSKVVILLTDGVNNVRDYPPLTYAQTAKQFGVRVYTIGVGTEGMAKVPVAQYIDGTFRFEERQVKIDEETLKEISRITGGRYFRATDGKKLADIYQEIDKLEKIKIEANTFIDPDEQFFAFALLALGLLALEFILRQTAFKSAA